MKIGIMTFHWATNYGAVLQAYALSKTLEQKGHDAWIIDYYPEKYRKSWIRAWLTHRLHRIPKRLRDLKKEEAIKRFRNRCLRKTKYFVSNQELRKAGFDFDCYICGSDQIWNPSFARYGERGGALSYFLDFVPEDSKRVAYAASFGVKKYPSDLIPAVCAELNCFERISVREKTGLDVLKEMNIDHAELVPDPTLLLEADAYESLIQQPKRERKYDFIYMLHGRDSDAIPLKRMREKEGMLEISCQSIGIEDWLTEIHGADLVITNSFHGVVFSILFERPFAALLIHGSGMNDRIVTLLETLGLSDRICENTEEFHNAPIDWASVRKKLEAYRKTGHQYLENILQEKGRQET